MDINREIDGFISYLLTHYGSVFEHIAAFIDGLTTGLETALHWLSPWGLIGLTIALGWWRLGRWFALFAAAATLFIFLGPYQQQAITTLALTLAATLLSILLGIPLGILASRRRLLGTCISPLLDFMQTMPAFVYLIPATMLFGLGRPPGIFATVLFAMPPIVRLTYLGLCQVESSVAEAGQVLGASDRQILWRLELPYALPSIMLGVNQTIMMAMSMVIIAAMVGAGGLGNDILTSIQQLDIGMGLQSGTVVVLLAILLDRLSASIHLSIEKPAPRN